MIHLRVVRSWNEDLEREGPPELGGSVELLVDRVVVPRRLREGLQGILGQEGSPPRYRATLRTGGRFEPWLAAIAPYAENSARGSTSPVVP